MQHLHDLNASDLAGLSPETVAVMAQQMLAHIRQQAQHIERQAHKIKFKDAKLEKVMFELARLKAWKFDARTEAMNAEQRRLFEETMAEDEACLQAQLEQLQSKSPAKQSQEEGDKPARKPRRQQLPDHLRRVEHHHEPDDTNCPSPGCGVCGWSRHLDDSGSSRDHRLDFGYGPIVLKNSPRILTALAIAQDFHSI